MGRLKKIVIACDSFKGSLTSAQVASAAAGGVRRVLPEAEVVEVAVADGGEGTMAMLVEALRGRYAEAMEPATAAANVAATAPSSCA